ncbi:MAG: hypothetical protein Tsb0016_12690 [Sphingomonadales bacterium]
MIVKFGLAAALLAAGMLMGASLPSHAQDSVEDPFALSSAGDAEKGRMVFNRCRACHVLSADAPQRPTGPHLGGIFGRQTAADPNFPRYSAALREADFAWTEQKLDQWLANPRGFLPGNKMAFAGLRNEQDRKDLIAYLRQATEAADQAAQ